ncbi:DUF805 domain-containing protein [Cohnella soli]|uniref:DUF805 domain-containing protein n=1 Tax=Cohnella soli TaxID=425005 RepID=A0ABW0I261_9BACL
MEWYVKVLKNYAVFEGRATRKEYWMFVLVNVIISIVFGIVEGLFGVGTWLSTLYSLAIIVPSLAVGARRLHDIGRSGWWQLIGLVPIVGAIILLIFYCTDSVEDNAYGPNPKAT